jgi:hypothetical protein
MTAQPLMPKATAVWLVENTALTFDQIADFCKLHPFEVAIGDDESVQSIVGRDPIVTGQLARDELSKGELTRITGSGSPSLSFCSDRFQLFLKERRWADGDRSPSTQGRSACSMV